MKLKQLEEKFLLVREGIYQNDLPNIKKQKNNTTVEVKSYNYLNDNNPFHQLNVYKAKLNHQKSPVIIDIHGGGWFYGDKETNGLFCMDFAERGFIVISLSYRLVPEANVIELVQDIFNAINYLPNLKDIYQMDLNNISIMGDSAGGHLAMLVCAFNNNPKYLKLYKLNPLKFTPNACIAIHPAPFFTNPFILNETKHESKKTFHNLKKLYFQKYAKKKKIVYAFFGDIFYSSLSKELPLLILTANGDTIVGDQAIKLKDLLEYKKYQFDFYVEENDVYGHVYNVTDPYKEASKKANNYIIKFIKKHQRQAK